MEDSLDLSCKPLSNNPNCQVILTCFSMYTPSSDSCTRNEWNYQLKALLKVKKCSNKKKRKQQNDNAKPNNFALSHTQREDWGYITSER